LFIIDMCKSGLKHALFQSLTNNQLLETHSGIIFKQFTELLYCTKSQLPQLWPNRQLKLDGFAVTQVIN